MAFHDKLKELTIEEIEPSNRARLKETVSRFNAGGSTPLATSFVAAYGLLEKQAQRQLGYGEYNIVVVTDGKANDAPTLANNVNYILEYTPVNIFTIGFCIGPEHTLNQPGRTYYSTADNPAELRQGLEQVLAEADSFDLQDF